MLRLVRTCCDFCLSCCGIVAKVENGKVVKLEGDSENPFNYGKICAKGNSAVFYLYNPHRVTQPMIRTNPKKGLDQDPEFKPINWDEALNLMAERLKKIRRQDPRMLYPVSFDLANMDMYRAWALGFGTLWRPFSSGFYCGNNVHPIVGSTVAAVEADPDTELGRYFLLVGAQVGSVVNYFTMGAASNIARKRPGGVKVVVVDPVCSYAAGKAEEWIPIRPGTDAAFLLGLVNQLINVLNIYDEPYLQHRTNAPYLVSKKDGKYVKLNGKPLVYDRRNGFVTYDKASEPVLVGRFEYGEVECMPAFQHLKEHVKKYTPVYVSEITSIPPETVVRIAEEYGKAANIGGFIEIKGRKLPYRPASTHWYRGLSAHKHSFISGMAAMLLNVLIGNIDIPGGFLGWGRYKTYATEEGLLALIPERGGVLYSAYPPRKVSLPKTLDLFDLTPVATYSRPFFIWGVTRPKEFKAPHSIDTMIVVRCNPVKTALSRKLMEKVMHKIPYLISITTVVDETAEFADLVFPDLHYLERLAVGLTFTANRLDRSGLPRIFFGQKPAVMFPYPTPWPRYINNAQILLEVAERGGFLGDVYKALNFIWDLKEPYKLDPNKRYSLEELIDRCLKNLLGEDKGLEWYLNNGLYIEDIPVEEMYRGAFWEGRVQLYYEFMLHAKEDLEQLVKKENIPIDTSDYIPLPEWRPCPAYNHPKKNEYPFFLVNYKTPHQSFSSLFQSIPVLQMLSDFHRDDDLLINTEAAASLGISDGDMIYVESPEGVKAVGRARVTELVHPEVIGCHGNGGRFARLFKGRERGIHWNDFVVFDEQHVDFVSSAVDSCVRVRIGKA